MFLGRCFFLLLFAIPQVLQWDVSSYLGEVSNILPAASFGVPLPAASGAFVCSSSRSWILYLGVSWICGERTFALHKTQLSHRNVAMLLSSPFQVGGCVHTHVSALRKQKFFPHRFHCSELISHCWSWWYYYLSLPKNTFFYFFLLLLSFWLRFSLPPLPQTFLLFLLLLLS